MKIAVVADTHNKIPAALLDAVRSADEIWHLGDVTDRGKLREFVTLGPPVFVVRGNCDDEEAWPMTLRRDLHGWRFLLVHIPPKRAPEGVDVVLHGHTHVPRNELVGATRFLNPGCVTRPNCGAPASYAWLEVEADGQLRWSPVALGSSLAAAARRG